MTVTVDLVEVEELLYCPRLHAFTPENTSVKKNGARRCKTCHREAEAARRRGEELPPITVPTCQRLHVMEGDNVMVAPGRPDTRQCRTCANEAQLRRARPNYRKHWLKRAYGLTVEDYDAMLQDQDGKCAACNEETDTVLFVDHNHVTGEVRGLLCRDCNLALGFVKDDVDRLRGLIAYLTGGQ